MKKGKAKPPEDLGDAQEGEIQLPKDLPVLDGFAVRERDADQPTLFPMEDVVLPPTIAAIRKPVAIVQSTPILGPNQEMTLYMRRLQNTCILLAQNDLAQREKAEPGIIKRILENNIQPLFETTISRLAELANIDDKNYERIYDALYRLQDTAFLWNVLGEDNTVAWSKRAHFLSSISRGLGDKKGLIRFRFDFEVLEIVLEPHLWAKYSLSPNTFGTSASTALYENCWKYIGTQHKRTAAMPVKIWIELLCGVGKYMSRNPDGSYKPLYGEFKRSVLNDSMHRINNVSSLRYTLRLIEHRIGRKVTHLQFAFEPKQEKSIGLPLMWQGDLTDTLLKIGFTESEIEDLSEAYQQEEVREGLTRLKEASERFKAAGKTMASRKAYLGGILSNMAASKKNGELDLDAIDKDVQARVAEQNAQERRQRAEQAFSNHQAEVFARSLAELDQGERDELMDSFLQSPEGQSLVKNLAITGKKPDISSRRDQQQLRAWMKAKRPLEYAALMPNPEDKSFEEWMAWRLDQ